MGCCISNSTAVEQRGRPALPGTISQQQAGEEPWKLRKGDSLYFGEPGRRLRARAHFLEVGHAITSRNGRYTAVMQRDGDLVVYGDAHARMFSSADSAGYARETRHDWRASLQENGSFTVSVEASPDATVAAEPHFCSSRDGGHARVDRAMSQHMRLVMGDDGDLCLYVRSKIKRSSSSNGGAFGDKHWSSKGQVHRDAERATTDRGAPLASPAAVPPPQSPPFARAEDLEAVVE
jgi:hypothetical protein